MGASSYLEQPSGREVNEDELQARLATNGIALTRMSAKTGGVFPIRLIRGDDVNPLLRAQGQSTLDPGRVILSRTLSMRYDTRAGDIVVFTDGKKDHRFEVIGISDSVGFYLESAQYVDLKSYALFSDRNPIFAANLEKSLGRYASARPFGGVRPYLSRAQEAALYPWYGTVKRGRYQAFWQSRALDRDFLLFDFSQVAAVCVAILLNGIATLL